MVLAVTPGCCWVWLSCFLHRRCLGQAGFVAFEPATEDLHGTAEVVAEFDEQVDVVNVPRTDEAVSEVVALIHHCLHFVAVRADEAERDCVSFSG